MHKIKVRQSNFRTSDGALIDRGANNGLLGNDCEVTTTVPKKFVNVVGIEDHEIKNLPMVSARATIATNKGPIIGIFHQYAYLGKGKSIHSSPQLEHGGLEVYDKSCKLGGLQCIKIPAGYTIPLAVRNGLMYMDMHKPTQEELDTLPQVIFTSDENWDPSILDDEPNIEDGFATDLPNDPQDNSSEEMERLIHDITYIAFHHFELEAQYGSGIRDTAIDLYNFCVKDDYATSPARLIKFAMQTHRTDTNNVFDPPPPPRCLRRNRHRRPWRE